MCFCYRVETETHFCYIWSGWLPLEVLTKKQETGFCRTVFHLHWGGKSDPEMNSEIRVSQEVTNRSNLSLRSDGTRNVEISKAKMTKISEAFCCILPLYLNSTKSFYLFHCNGAVTVQRNLPGVSRYLKSVGNAELSDRIIWKIFFLHHPWVKK